MIAKGSRPRRFTPSDDNARTRIGPVRPVPKSLDALFARAYPVFAERCREVVEPGMAVIAVSPETGRYAGRLVVAPPDGWASVSVGRHTRCDLALAECPDLPLRQLVLLVEPQAPGAHAASPRRYRVVDLQTPGGLRDERGRTLRGLRADGPAVLSCAGYALYLLPLGDPEAWPATGEAAWAALPPRVFVDEQLGDAAPPAAVARPRRRTLAADSADPPPHGDDRITRITSIAGPHSPDASLVVDGDRVGVVERRGPRSRHVLEVGRAALQRGVLFGRYDRCQSSVGDDEGVSRVHALLVEHEGALLLVDAGSTNGVAVQGADPAPLHVVEPGVEYELSADTTLRWCP
jgi:hypothetical protein